MDPLKFTKIITIKTNGSLKWTPFGSDSEKSLNDVQASLLRTMNSVQLDENTVWPYKGLFIQLVNLVARPGYPGEPAHTHSDKGPKCCLYHDLCGNFNFVCQPSNPVKHISGYAREVYFGVDCKIEIDLSYSTRNEDNSSYPYLPLWTEVKEELGPYIEILEGRRIAQTRHEKRESSSSRRTSSLPKSMFGPLWRESKKKK